MVIRRGEVGDLEAIGNIAKESFNDYSEQDFLSMMNNPNYLFFVALDKNLVVGFVVFLCFDEKMEIIKIATKEDFRGRGVALALLNQMENWGRNNQKQGILLEVNEKNLKARRLYDKVGFEIIHIRKKYYDSKDDAIVMQKIFV